MTVNAPIKDQIVDSEGFANKTWIKWFLQSARLNGNIVNNPTLPYTMVNQNEIIFISTSVVGVVNLLPVENGLRCRVVNLPTSTANVSLTPNSTDLLYGVNAADTILPGEARDVDGNLSAGWY